MNDESHPDPAYLQYLRMGSCAFVYAVAEESGKAWAITEKMLLLADQYNDWNSDNVRHVAWIVRGLVHLSSHDLNQSCQCLIASGRIQGSPQLHSFGPNMLLAARLLRQKQTLPVIEYLELVKKFWNDSRLDTWISLIKQEKPVDFEGNLVYHLTS